MYLCRFADKENINVSNCNVYLKMILQEENEKYNPKGKQNASTIRHCTEEDYICTQKENEKQNKTQVKIIRSNQGKIFARRKHRKSVNANVRFHSARILGQYFRIALNNGRVAPTNWTDSCRIFMLI